MDAFYKNDYFTLYNNKNKVHISVEKEGYDISIFTNEVLYKFPRIKITKFIALSSAISNVLNSKIEIGIITGIVEISVTNDALTAYANLKLTEEELAALEDSELEKIIQKELEKQKVVYGILPINKEMITLEDKFVVAKGLEPEFGEDATITMYEIKEQKPTVKSEGGVDFYEMNVINKILVDEWLGEMVEPTKGVDGRTVYDTIIVAPNGRAKQLAYDPKTVRKDFNEKKGITTLRAKQNGAVVYIGEAISVLNAITVDGTVGYGTGNIDFKGFVDIEESVEDNFSVVADESIQILGTMGVGAVDVIESRKGDVNILGGVAGRHKAIIRAKRNVYTKFASDCKIICEGTVNIGYYAMNCEIEAKEVVFEAENSRLIGGKTKVGIQLIVGELGSKSYTKTQVFVSGFERARLRAEYDNLYRAIDICKENLEKYKAKYDKLKRKPSTKFNDEQTDNAYKKMQKYRKQLDMLYETREQYIFYLHAKGEGEVKAKKSVYTNVSVTIKDKGYVIHDDRRLKCSLYYKDGIIIEE